MGFEQDWILEELERWVGVSFGNGVEGSVGKIGEVHIFGGEMGRRRRVNKSWFGL